MARGILVPQPGIEPRAHDSVISFIMWNIHAYYLKHSSNM